jgi:hypothetical protein
VSSSASGSDYSPLVQAGAVPMPGGAEIGVVEASSQVLTNVDEAVLSQCASVADPRATAPVVRSKSAFGVRRYFG